MKLRNIIIVGAILSIAAGFILGKTVIANSPAPGSNADPVVSKSYVDNAVQERIAELEEAVAELSVQSQALQNTINELQTKVNKTGGKTTTPATPTTPSTGTDTPGTSPDTGTTTPGTDGSVTGKIAFIKSTNNFVNLRKGASTNDEIIQRVNKDEPMLILLVKDDWYQVQLSNGTEGWVASWVVDVK